MSTAPVVALSRAQRRRRLAAGLLRASAVTVVLVAVYYVAPLDNLSGVPLGLTLAVGLLVLAGVASFRLLIGESAFTDQ